MQHVTVDSVADHSTKRVASISSPEDHEHGSRQLCGQVGTTAPNRIGIDRHLRSTLCIWEHNQELETKSSW
jgi:hypothetical protein